MDKFREKQNSQCGPPHGVHCHCCNPWRGHKNPHNQRKLNKIARLRLKREDRKLFEKDVDIEALI